MQFDYFYKEVPRNHRINSSPF